MDAIYCLAVRFKAAKQDPRVTRRSASDGADFLYVGDVPGPFSMLRWNQVFMQFFASERDGEAPFFLANRNRIRPYTYPAAMADLKERCARVGVDGSRYGLHGIRVAGYDASVRANGHEVTICHGLWAGPASANRHHRFDVSSEIVPMAANMVRYHTVGERRVGFESSSSGPECPTSIGSAADTALWWRMSFKRGRYNHGGGLPRMEPVSGKVLGMLVQKERHGALGVRGVRRTLDLPPLLRRRWRK